MNLAPNGKPSKLTPEQYALVRTPAFKAWFGDWENSPETASKVVDKNGEPKVLFHGSSDIDKINVFKSSKGFDYSFFANDFYEALRYTPNGNDIDKVKSFFINSLKKFDCENLNEKEINDIKKLLNIDSVKDVFFKHIKYIGFSKIDSYKEDLGYEGLNDDDFLFKIFIEGGDNWVIIEHPIIQNYIKSNGYDSFTTLEGDDGNIAVYQPTQIKLADGTNTTFDANNPDIRYSGGGETPYVSDDFQIGYDGAYEHLIAPNGKLSNLTPEQYALVRTPAFKAWFGFWDLYGKSKNYYDYGVREIAIALKSEKEYAIKEAVEFLSSQVTKDDVLIPMPSRIGIATDTKKLAEEIAKKTGAKMFNCLVGIERDSIYELKKSNKNVTKFDFKFELNCEIPKARNYFIVDNVIGTGITMKNALQQVIKNLGVVNVNPLVYAIDVKNISKVVDENGEPLVVFHGTDKEFNFFDKNRAGELQTIKGVDRKIGIYFSNKKSIAQFYTKNKGKIIEVFLNMKIPLKATKDEFSTFEISFFKETGNDGIIWNRGSGMYVNNKKTPLLKGEKAEIEYIVFESNQIKLADGTNTTFDSNNPDIRYAEGGSISDLLSSQEVEDKLGRKLDWWNDDIVYLSGIEYKKVYLRPEYKRVF